MQHCESRSPNLPLPLPLCSIVGAAKGGGWWRSWPFSSDATFQKAKDSANIQTMSGSISVSWDSIRPYGLQACPPPPPPPPPQASVMPPPGRRPHSHVLRDAGWNALEARKKRRNRILDKNNSRIALCSRFPAPLLRSRRAAGQRRRRQSSACFRRDAERSWRHVRRKQNLCAPLRCCPPTLLQESAECHRYQARHSLVRAPLLPAISFCNILLKVQPPRHPGEASVRGVSAAFCPLPAAVELNSGALAGTNTPKI
jgi:hypothetical protein